MMTVNEVGRLAGVSIRTLHYYDQIGLLHPTGVTDTGYRLYDDTALEKLQQILLFRELEFPLKDIGRIINDKTFDRDKALEQQIELLTLKKEHLEELITFARGIKRKGVRNMDFTAFDTTKLEEYTKKAKEQWGDSAAYKEFEQKNEGRSREAQNLISEGLMKLFTEFGHLMDKSPENEQVQGQVRKLQEYITEHYYQCTREILAGLGKMYGAGGEFTENIDRFGGRGCAEFCAKAIAVYCSK